LKLVLDYALIFVNACS